MTAFADSPGPESPRRAGSASSRERRRKTSRRPSRSSRTIRIVLSFFIFLWFFVPVQRYDDDGFGDFLISPDTIGTLAKGGQLPRKWSSPQKRGHVRKIRRGARVCESSFQGKTATARKCQARLQGFFKVVRPRPFPPGRRGPVYGAKRSSLLSKAWSCWGLGNSRKAVTSYFRPRDEKAGVIGHHGQAS